MFRDLWPQIREKFPPARAVAVLTPIVLPTIAIVNGWLADHLPFIAEQVGPTEVTGIVLATIAAGVALAYKWLDGRAKWEEAQISAHVGLAQADPALVPLAEKVLDPPPR